MSLTVGAHPRVCKSPDLRQQGIDETQSLKPNFRMSRALSGSTASTVLGQRPDRSPGAKPSCAALRRRDSRCPSRRYWLTMSFFIPARAPRRSVFSCAPTLNLSRLFTKSSTSALSSASLMLMPRCASFMFLPV